MNRRKELLANIDDLIHTYCDGCLLFNYIKNEEGRRAAHRFCINQCTVGEQIKRIGKELSPGVEKNELKP